MVLRFEFSEPAGEKWQETTGKYGSNLPTDAEMFLRNPNWAWMLWYLEVGQSKPTVNLEER